MNLTTRQYARLVSEWLASIGLDPLQFGTHSLRRTKATLIYKQAICAPCNCSSFIRRLRARVIYLGIEVEDALAMAEQVDV